VRRALVGLLDGLALPFEERPFSLAEAKTAREAFLTSSSGFLLPVTRLDGASIGDGKVGPIVRELRRRFDGHVARQTA
jgi:D-alanine transaminase